MEVIEPDRHHRDAAERTVGSGDPAAQGNAGRPGAQTRMIRIADVKADVRVIAMDGEVAPIGEIHIGRLVAHRIERDVALRIENEDGAEIAGGGRAIEQRLMPQPRRRGHQLRVLDAVEHRLQRQSVQFDIALDVALGDQRNVA